MAPRIADVDEPDAPAAGQSAPELSAVIATGATWCGVPVRVVRVELIDGRVQRLELPAAVVKADTPMKRAVVQVVDEMLVGDVLSYDRIADRAGYSNSGKLREFVKQYADESGRLAQHRMGWEKVK